MFKCKQLVLIFPGHHILVKHTTLFLQVLDGHITTTLHVLLQLVLILSLVVRFIYAASN